MGPSCYNHLCFFFFAARGGCAPLGVILLGDNGRELEPCVCDFATVITAVKLLSLFWRVSVCVHSENRGEPCGKAVCAPLFCVCFSLSLPLSLFWGREGEGEKGAFPRSFVFNLFCLVFLALLPRKLSGY